MSIALVKFKGGRSNSNKKIFREESVKQVYSSLDSKQDYYGQLFALIRNSSEKLFKIFSCSFIVLNHCKFFLFATTNLTVGGNDATTRSKENILMNIIEYFINIDNINEILCMNKYLLVYTTASTKKK